MNNPWFLIAGFVCFVLLAVLRRDLAVYLIILLLPTYQIRFQLAGFVPMTFLEGMILILAAVEFLRFIWSWRGVRPPQTERTTKQSQSLERLWDFVRNHKLTNTFILLFLTAALISIFTAPNLIKAAGIFKAYFLEAILFYFLVLLIIDNQKKLKWLFKILAILVLAISVFGIFQFLTLYGLPFNWWGVGVESRRIISILNHPNALALLIGPILAMLILLRGSFLPLVRGRIKEGVLYWASIILGMVSLYLSFSRAAWLALLVTILGLKLLSPGHGERLGERSKKVISYTLLVIVIILAVPFSRSKILDLARGQDLAQQSRLVLWSAAIDILKKNPLSGVGLMGFHEAYKNYPLGPDRVVQNYPHNFFLNFWLETGLLGLISIVGLLIIFYRKIFVLLKPPSPQGRGIKIASSPLRGEDKGRGAISKSFALAAAAGMSMIILHGLVDVSYFKNDLSVLFWLIYALPYLSLRSAEG